MSNVQQKKTVFLSHVSSDKETVVRPFAVALEANAVTYWLDEAEIGWGDQIVTKINEGLAKSRFVVCFISSEFADRQWPIAELSSALSAQLSDGVKRVLPIVVGDPEEVLAKLPILRSYRYMAWDAEKYESLAREVKRMVELDGTA